MSDTAGHRTGFSVTGGREAKAWTIRAVIEAVRGPLSASDTVLDVGTGSGGIATALGVRATLYATDRTDQRTERSGYRFVVADERLPFADNSFDVVISNHVIEHVSYSARHLDEIRRVLKPSGICYLATPNRWWPLEVHTGLWLLHWLPLPLFNRLAARLGRLDETLTLLSLRQLRLGAADLFTLETWHDRMAKDPSRFALALPGWAAWIVRRLPMGLVGSTRAWQPTLVVILRSTA